MTDVNKETEKVTKAAQETTTVPDGILLPEQASRFIDLVMDESVLAPYVRIEKIASQSKELPRLLDNGRATFAKEEGLAPDGSANVTSDKLVVEPKRFMSVFDFTDEVAQYNIERGPGAMDRNIAGRVRNDIELFTINSNKLGVAANPGSIGVPFVDNSKYIKDKALSQIDGIMQQARTGSNLVDMGGAVFNKTALRKGKAAIPTKYRNNLVCFAPSDLVDILNETLSERETAFGDERLRAMGGVRIMNMDIVPVPLMGFEQTVTEHVQLNGTTAVTLKNQNISDVVVLPAALAAVETDPFTITTDYTVDLATGEIARSSGGNIGDGDTVKVQYIAKPQAIITPRNNLIQAFTLNMRKETDRDIKKQVNTTTWSFDMDTIWEIPEGVALLNNIKADT